MYIRPDRSPGTENLVCNSALLPLRHQMPMQIHNSDSKIETLRRQDAFFSHNTEISLRFSFYVLHSTLCNSVPVPDKRSIRRHFVRDVFICRGTFDAPASRNIVACCLDRINKIYKITLPSESC